MFVPLTPIRFLQRAADLFGIKVGVVCGPKAFTFAEFAVRCERLASALVSSGVAPGDRVAYLSFNTHKLLEGYYGVVQAGAIVMPLNVRLAAGELAAILDHSGAKMLLFEDDFAPLVEKLRLLCPRVERYISLDTEYEDFLTRGSPERADIMKVDENSIAELFYTSGSTGLPKGVMLSHRSLYLHALAGMNIYRDPQKAVDLHTIPLFHANGWGKPQVDMLLGIKQVMVRRFDPALVFRLAQEHRATHMCLVPTMANALVNAPERTRYDLSSLVRVMIGGAASSPELVRRVEDALGCECISGYGLTETSPILTVSIPREDTPIPDEDERRRRKAMAGWPFPNVEVRVVNLHGGDVPKDMQTIGEVIARSDHVMDGYYGDPQGTGAAMSGSWFHTGDMAVWDEYGYIHIVDRKKEIIISGGENISSLEVERAISAHPDVFECAVVGAPDEKWGEVPAALVARRPGSGLSGDDLLEFLKDRLGAFKMPRVIEISDEPLPKTGTGKIRKMHLKERFWQGLERRVNG
jgi:fatty-acyl-CoA synthase